MRDWKIVSRDGNPSEEGEYDVVLLFPRHTVEGTQDKGAIITTRYFGPAEEGRGWIMKDQPSSGLVWMEGSGSYLGESVYAWMEKEQLTFPELPENVVPYGE